MVVYFIIFPESGAVEAVTKVDVATAVGHLDQAVFFVIDKGLPIAVGHVAIGIVLIGLAIGGGDGMGPAGTIGISARSPLAIHRNVAQCVILVGMAA